MGRGAEQAAGVRTASQFLARWGWKAWILPPTLGEIGGGWGRAWILWLSEASGLLRYADISALLLFPRNYGPHSLFG